MSSSDDNSDLDEFTELLEEVASKITPKKFMVLKRLCKDKIRACDLCIMEDPGDLLDALRDDDVISPTNTTFLVKMLKNKNVRMKKLADKVKKFTDLYNKKLGHTTKATTNDTSSMVGSKRKRSPDNLFGQSAQQKKKSTGRKGIVSREPGPRDTQGDSAVPAHITRAHTSVLSSTQSDTRSKRTKSADATYVSESKRKQDSDEENIETREPGPSHQEREGQVTYTVDSTPPQDQQSSQTNHNERQHEKIGCFLTDAAGLPHSTNDTQRGILLINDEWGTGNGGISTINRQLAKIIAHCNMRVYCTSLHKNEKDKKDAQRLGVELVFPEVEPSDEQASLKWINRQYRTYFSNLANLSNIEVIVGHVQITSEGALKIRDDYFPDKKVYLFNHTICRDTEIQKTDCSIGKVDDREKIMKQEVRKCQKVFSVGPRMHRYLDDFHDLKNVENHVFLPAADCKFAELKIIQPSIKSDVTLLTFGRVSGVASLKGYDIVADAMSKVAGKRAGARRYIWRIRGIPESEHAKCKADINKYITSSNIQLDPRPYGTIDDICDDIQQSHLMIMASRSEPFGMVGLEAITAGLPVLITNNSGLAKFLKEHFKRDMVDPIIVKVGVNDVDFERDTRCWSDKISEVIEDDYDRAFKRAQKLKNELLDCDAVKKSHQLFIDMCQEK